MRDPQQTTRRETEREREESERREEERRGGRREAVRERREGRDEREDGEKWETRERERGERESLMCQLQFSKEESTLMRKKMAKLGREKEELEQEIQKYKSVYGDVDSPLPLAELAGGGPHSTREAELRLRLKLVENRGLRAENEDIRCQYERDCFGREPFGSMPSSPYGGDALESAGELRRHLQFVEEEAELLRRSISEIEDHNKQLTSELNRFKFGPRDEEVEVGVMLMKTGNGSNGGSGGNGSGVVMKLQYENRVLMSNVQRCDLAQHLGLRTGSPRDSDADSDTGRRDTAEEEETGRLLLLHPKREGPVGGESDSEDLFEKTTTTSGFGSHKPSDATELANLRREEREMFMNVKREAERLGKTVDRLITDTDSLIYEGKIVVTGGDSLCIEGFRGHRGEGSGEDRGDTTTLPESLQDSQVLDTINTRMKAFRTELHIFMDKVDHLGDGLRERGGDRDRGDDLSPMPNLTESSSFLSGVTSMSRDSPISTLGRDLVTDFQSQSGARDELEWRLGQERDVETQGQSHDQGGLPQGPAQNRGAILGHTRYHRAPLASLRPEGSACKRRGSACKRRGQHVNAGGQHVNAGGQHVNAGGQHVNAGVSMGQHVNAGGQHVNAGGQHVNAGGQHVNAGGQHVNAGGQHVNAGGQHVNAGGQHLRDTAEPEMQFRLDQDRRHNTIVFYMKLRWILMHWRLGRRTETGEEAAHSEYEKLEGIPELGVGENRRVLHALRSLLEEFREELREEESRSVTSLR
ncbi:unnamed protein product [Coregonus sp. 'balchen']|nr:unnamed protein product [Coregonus sp. 'balchen']